MDGVGDVGDVKMRVCLMTARRSMIQYPGGVDVKNEAKESNNSQDDECIESPKISVQSSHLQFLCAVISWH
jgi:hypothetical protein